jgi:YbbR domain-containing protein
LICVFLSMFFWFITTFSKDYNSTITFPVTYLNVPKTKVIVNHLPENIDVDISASGFTILYYKLRRVMQPIRVDLHELRAFKDNPGYFIAVNTKLEKISRQFGNKLKILKIVPDTLFVNYSKRISKTVPVKLNADITYNKEYQLKDSIRLVPSKVFISGPEEQVNKIKYAETELVKLEDVDSEEKKDVKLLLANDTSLIDLSNTIVELTVPVTKFTEANLEIPVQVDNLPKGYSLKIFPDKVALKFTIPFDELDKMDASSFRIRVDYSKKTNSKKLKVEVVKKPSNIKSLKVNPEKVEFIVRK